MRQLDKTASTVVPFKLFALKVEAVEVSLPFFVSYETYNVSIWVSAHREKTDIELSKDAVLSTV